MSASAWTGLIALVNMFCTLCQIAKREATCYSGVLGSFFFHQSIIKLHVTIIVPSFQKMQQLDGRFVIQLPPTETGLI